MESCVFGITFIISKYYYVKGSTHMPKNLFAGHSWQMKINGNLLLMN
jgi:hypothetical protein